MNEIESLQAARVAHTLVLAALISTHPQYREFQLLLTSALEQQLAPDSALGQTLNDAQQEAVRGAVE